MKGNSAPHVVISSSSNARNYQLHVLPTDQMIYVSAVDACSKHFTFMRSVLPRFSLLSTTLTSFALCLFVRLADSRAMPVPRSRKRDTTLYDLLEVSPDATDAQIAKAYKTAAMKYHPGRAAAEASATMSRRTRTFRSQSRRSTGEVQGDLGGVRRVERRAQEGSLRSVRTRRTEGRHGRERRWLVLVHGAFAQVRDCLGATSLFDLLMGGAGRQHREHGEPKGQSKVIPLKYVNDATVTLIMSRCLRMRFAE